MPDNLENLVKSRDWNNRF